MSNFDIKFSHMGITVFDLDKMIHFYSDILGFPVTDRGLLHGHTPIAFLSRDPHEHHQIALIQTRPQDAQISTINQISMRLPNIDTLRLLRDYLKSRGVEQFRMAMHGTAMSFYIFDPEGNQIELFTDTPWYIPQPCSLPYDLDKSTDIILEEMEAFCRQQPGFKMADEWRTEFFGL